MKNLITVILLALFVLSSSALFAEKDPDPSKPFSGRDEKVRTSLKIKDDYKKATKEFAYKTGAPIAFFIDFQLGVGISNASTESNASNVTVSSESKPGFTVGGVFFVNLFDFVSFSSGLTFDGKSFGLTKTTTNVTSTDTSKTTVSGYVPANFINIPININIGGMLSEKFGLWFNGGPYLGFLTSQPANTYPGMGYKSFDLGLNGTLTANYVVMYPLSVIFGTTFKYGGLNNLA
ncbi:MAG: outer membrane beta-barrel protein, partial [Ignavibacteriae bacterium]|nr:outer membrane beta-barrel protein [Ignavibacteriota bacterium]